MCMHMCKKERRNINLNQPFFLVIVFKKDLEKDVAGDTSGDFCRLLLSLVEVK